MKTAELQVAVRDTTKKTTNRKLRKEGFVPANVYGPGIKNAYCAFDDREFRKAYKGHSSASLILTLKSADQNLEGRKVILKSIERDPATWETVHVDFYQIDMNRALTVSVPLEFQGTPVGVKIGGGITQIIRRSVMIKALPGDLPESIVVDISGVELNHSLHVSDLKISDKIQVMDEAEYTLMSVVEPEKEEVKAVEAVVAPDGTGDVATAATGEPAAAAAGAKPAAKSDKK
ncbi:MAG: 50S ribosomal protein L25 [Deltaproteobacteria bacterium CG11_big_fil_rev_8_21_14_0_20_45_16]|nr:MAG: 50S ribosomal protein L25 [Deltaproteobacteria bacterium CG11_big_fil_rev_8_21_14_0_20_45_16]